MTKSLHHLGLLASLMLGLVARADTTLAPSSPFAPAAGSNAAAAENQPLELRGIMLDGGAYRFSVFDPAKKSGQWVRLNESGHDFTVRTHDVARDTVTVDFQGRSLTLALRTAKVAAVAVPESPTGPRPTGGGLGAGPVPRPPTPEESARFNRAVEEINRRRALREKTPIPGPMPSPTANPAAGPGPVPRPQ
jgi:hypothetical protein